MLKLTRKIVRQRNSGQEGFTLVELSIVLVVVGLILAAVSIGKDLQRNAVYQRLSSSFVQGWAVAYSSYFDRTGIVLGDNPAIPTLKVNRGAGELCGAPLQTFMDAAGVAMPEGRAEGSEDRYNYLDSNGNPQEVQVCFNNVSWSVPGAAPGTYVTRSKNVMVLKSLTPDLARYLDGQVDGKSDARFGLLRENSQAAVTSGNATAWSIDNRMAYGSTTVTNRDESQIAVVTAYYLMNP